MTVKEIDKIIEDGESLRLLAQAYGELASQEIKKIRSEVERNRAFFDEISFVFCIVKKFAAIKKITLTKSKKRVCVVLTSNYRFNGNINDQLLEFFARQLPALQTDIILVGKSAIDYFKPLNYNYQTIALKKDMPSPEELATIVEMIKNYNQVLIFYSQLKSILVQLPIAKDITLSTMPESEMAGLENKGFIFEPEILKILQFFDSQIITLLLEQTFLESELSKTASRLIAMDQAQVEAKKFTKEQRTLRAYAKRSKEDQMILEGIAALRKRTYT